jgi:hypothetical protein
LYPDGKKVHYLPDGKEEFSINGYRNFLDPKKRFDRLRLYLCEIGNLVVSSKLEIYNTEQSIFLINSILISLLQTADKEYLFKILPLI